MLSIARVIYHLRSQLIQAMLTTLPLEFGVPIESTCMPILQVYLARMLFVARILCHAMLWLVQVI